MFYEETITDIHQHGNKLFSFKTTRDKSFRFKNGEFTMIGLDNGTSKRIVRAYSMVSTCYDDHLEFLSIKVPDGEFTSRLQYCQPGDTILVRSKATGSLVIDYVYQKKNLVLLSTGTGIAPFMSIVHDFETYDKFENVYLFHTVKSCFELPYKSRLEELESVYPNFKYIESVTGEPYHRTGRFWQHIEQYIPGGFNKDRDAVMICGSPELNSECREKFTNLGWTEGNSGILGDFMLERSFAG